MHASAARRPTLSSVFARGDYSLVANSEFNLLNEILVGASYGTAYRSLGCLAEGDGQGRRRSVALNLLEMTMRPMPIRTLANKMNKSSRSSSVKPIVESAISSSSRLSWLS